MTRIALALFLASLLLTPAAAQRLGERLPGQRSETGMPGAKAADGLRPCPRYGPGFVRLEGSNVCMRASGAVRFEYGVGNRRGAVGSGTRSGAVVELDARVDTDYGPLRAVVQGGGFFDTGVMAGRRW